MILLIEGFMAFTLCFFLTIPPRSSQNIVWLRGLAGVTGLNEDDDDGRRDVLFIETERAKRIRRIFEWKRIWILPATSFLPLLYPPLTWWHSRLDWRHGPHLLR